jgi:nucleoside-diphosphate-sugar epimerase
MNVFLTGGTGLVGSHAIELLRSNGHTVRALVRDSAGKAFVESLGATALFGSVQDPKAWHQANGSDAIVHSAAIITSRRSWDQFQTTNADGARCAARKAAELGIRLVHLSSVAVYGRRATDGAKQINEDTEWAELAPAEFYARSKRQAEDAIAAVARDAALSYVLLRPCVIYGERDRTFLPHVLRILRLGIAPLVGPGTNTLALVYAGNVAAAVLAALEHPEAEGPFNVANDGDITQQEFFTAVGAALGKRTRLIRVPVAAAYVFVAAWQGLKYALLPKRYAGFGASAVRYLTSDNPYTSERARAELGWRPITQHAEAIERSIRWFERER